MAPGTSLRERLVERRRALLIQRAEKAADFARQLAVIDAQIAAIQSLAQNWDTLTLDQALAQLELTGVSLDLKS
jgi:hypothetical protein